MTALGMENTSFRRKVVTPEYLNPGPESSASAESRWIPASAGTTKLR